MDPEALLVRRLKRALSDIPPLAELKRARERRGRRGTTSLYRAALKAMAKAGASTRALPTPMVAMDYLVTLAENGETEGLYRGVSEKRKKCVIRFRNTAG